MRSGVKQGDPLSSYFFNFVLDELLGRLAAAGIGIRLENEDQKVGCVAYEDNL